MMTCRVLCCVLIFVHHFICGQGQGDRIMRPPHVSMNANEYNIKKLNAVAFGFVCTATGEPKPEIQWFKDDQPVRSEQDIGVTPDGTLSFQRMDPKFKGKYQCRAKNEFGVSMSNLTELDYAFFNDFPAPPTSVATTAVNEGDPLQLKCTYADPFSNPRPQWTWVRQSSYSDPKASQIPVTLGGRLSVDDRGNLYFQHVLRDDNMNNYYHMCEAWNPIENAKRTGSPHRLNIRPVSPIQAKPARLVYNNGPNIEVVAGESIDLYCIFEGYPTVEVSWEKISGGPMPLQEYTNGRTRMTIANSKNDNTYEGQYRCQGFQDGVPNQPAATATFTVSVLEKPRFIEGPVNTDITEGGTAQFTCRAAAEPPPDFTWYVNGQPLSELKFDQRRQVIGNQFTFEKLRRGSGAGDSDLQVVTCMARNEKNGREIGRSYMSGYINVVMPINFRIRPHDQNVSAATEKVVLDCAVTSDPSITPTISWHFQQVPITLVPGKIEQTSTNSLVIYPQEFNSWEDVLGEYMCFVQTFSPVFHTYVTAELIREGGALAVTAASINLWWIGLILALILLLLIIVLIICCIRRQGTGETHDVDKVERQMGNDPIKDLEANGFKDYLPKEKAPIPGNRDLEDFSLEAVDNEGYDEDNDSLEQYAVDAYPGEYGTALGRRKSRDPNMTNQSYRSNPADQSYGAPGYGGPINTGFVPDDTTV